VLDTEAGRGRLEVVEVGGVLPALEDVGLRRAVEGEALEKERRTVPQVVRLALGSI
jgi:hypothetical protein